MFRERGLIQQLNNCISMVRRWARHWAINLGNWRRLEKKMGLVFAAEENHSTMLLIFFSLSSYATRFLNKLILQCNHLHMEM